MRFVKTVGHAREPKVLAQGDAGVTLFSAEDFKLESGETHSFRTGVILEIPEGTVGMLVVSMEQGVKGISVAGPMVSATTISEVRVCLSNNHREAYEVTAGAPIAQLVLLSGVQSPTDGEEAVDEDGEGREDFLAKLRERAAKLRTPDDKNKKK